MTQNASDVEIANQGFAAFRQDLNDVLEDITTLHSGDTAPTTTYANQFWYETDTDKLYIRNEDNDAWIELFTLDQVNDKIAALTVSAATIEGDLTVDTNTLHVDSTNNRVGINDATPSEELDINGDGSDVRIRMYDGAGASVGGIEHSGANFDISNTATSTATMTFTTGSGSGTERMRIDSSGNVGIGTGSPSNPLTVSSSDNLLAKFASTNATGGIDIADNTSYARITNSDGLFRIDANDDGSGSNTVFSVATAGTEQLRIDSAGNIFQNNDQTSKERGYKIYGNSTSETYIYGRTNADTSPVFFAQVGGTARAEIESDGSFHSISNSYGGFSDQNYKENIELSGSQWDDIKAVQVKKYSWIHDSLDAPNQLGVVAQDLEASGMGGLVANLTKLVQQDDGTETPALDNDGNPITYKSVKYSVLYMKALKALQEAITKIETLEAQNADFETRIAALEN